MNTAKERLLKIIDEIPDQEVDKILVVAEYLKSKKEKKFISIFNKNTQK